MPLQNAFLPLGIQPLQHATRQEVFNALYQFLLNLPAPPGMQWNTTGQYLKIWDDIPADAQPAWFLYRGPQSFEQKHVFGVTKLHWRAAIWIYFRTSGCNIAADNAIDQILDNLEKLFQGGQLDNRVTLNNLVWHCWLDGSAVFDAGLVDGQAVLVCPISILL